MRVPWYDIDAALVVFATLPRAIKRFAPDGNHASPPPSFTAAIQPPAAFPESHPHSRTPNPVHPAATHPKNNHIPTVFADFPAFSPADPSANLIAAFPTLGKLEVLWRHC